jgi:branched-chain amino acid transport system ATP-binding protein
MALLEATGVSKAFGAVKAINGIDLAIERHDRLGIIGPNGSGKTTFFNCLSGRLRPDSGTILWRGTDVTRRPMHRISRLGLVRTFQEGRAFISGTVSENIEMALTVGAVRDGGREDHGLPNDAAGIVEFVGLSDMRERPTISLPFGSLRRLGIAMALATQPEMMLLDEPAAGLNPAEGVALGELLNQVMSAGVTVVIVDHDMDFLLPLVTRLVVFAEGTKRKDGLPGELRQDPDVIAMYLGTAADLGAAGGTSKEQPNAGS